MINKKQTKITLLNILNHMIENETDNMEFILSNNDLKLDFIFDIRLKNIIKKVK